MATDRREHWDRVFSGSADDQVSWFEVVPETSLGLIRACNLPPSSLILDVGAGVSRLPDSLLDAGFTNIAVLDISPTALEQTKARLGPVARSVRFIVADIADWHPDVRVDLWHDRVVLHFLTSESERVAYAAALRSAVRPGGYVVISGFAPSGPERCSGLPVMRASGADLAELLGLEFERLEAFEKDHVTPKGVRQRFVFTRFRRRSTKLEG